jgi:Icc-related predicted phosphoesterase
VRAMERQVNILAISDQVEPLLYAPGIRERFRHVDLVVSCGDLPDYYLEYIISVLNVPLYGVNGNHDQRPKESEAAGLGYALGAVNLHGRVVSAHGLLLAGLEGSPRYNDGPYQYSEAEMRWQVARLVPWLLANKTRYGRYLDILVTHAPPRNIHDEPDRCHRGFAVFRWLLGTFRPRYHLHGHCHVYNRRTATSTRFGDTLVLNAYGYRELRVPLPGSVALPARPRHA